MYGALYMPYIRSILPSTHIHTYIHTHIHTYIQTLPSHFDSDDTAILFPGPGARFMDELTAQEVLNRVCVCVCIYIYMCVGIVRFMDELTAQEVLKSVCVCVYLYVCMCRDRQVHG